jgi:hypothetical protein
MGNHLNLYLHPRICELADFHARAQRFMVGQVAFEAYLDGVEGFLGEWDVIAYHLVGGTREETQPVGTEVRCERFRRTLNTWSQPDPPASFNATSIFLNACSI